MGKVMQVIIDNYQNIVNMLTIFMGKLDDLTFNTMLSVLQSGMWLLNDLETYLRPLDMSQARLSILLAITETSDGIISPKDIARITGKSRPAITRTIDSLSERGLLSINRDFEDGRRKKLTLTVKGQELLNTLIPTYNQRILAMCSRFTEEEKLLLGKLLGKINFLHKKENSQGYIMNYTSLFNSIKEKSHRGFSADIDSIMSTLNKADLPTTRAVDFYLGSVTNSMGLKRLEYYLFSGTQRQRNYAALFFARKNEWTIINRAVKKGCIDKIQAYSR